MNCADAREQLSELDDEARRHALSCAACSEWLRSRLFPGDAASAPDVDSLWRGMPEALAREAHWRHRARHLPTWARYTAAACGALLSLLAVALTAARSDLAALPAVPFWLLWAAAAGLTLLTGGACLRPLQRRALSPRSHDSLCMVAVLFGVLGVALPELQHATPALRGTGPELLPRALGCFAWGSAMLMVAVAGGSTLLRGSTLLPGHRALAAPRSLWAAGILVAQLMLALHCPLVGRPHLALGHAAIGVVTLGALAVAQTWLQRPRASVR